MNKMHLPFSGNFGRNFCASPKENPRLSWLKIGSVRCGFTTTWENSLFNKPKLDLLSHFNMWVAHPCTSMRQSGERNLWHEIRKQCLMVLRDIHFEHMYIYITITYIYILYYIVPLYDASIHDRHSIHLKIPSWWFRRLPVALKRLFWLHLGRVG